MANKATHMAQRLKIRLSCNKMSLCYANRIIVAPSVLTQNDIEYAVLAMQHNYLRDQPQLDLSFKM